MASAIPRQILLDDDDDNFDWEAAVKQIDVACQSGIPSTPSSLQSSFLVSSKTSLGNLPKVPFSEANKKPETSRQSTLHKFIVHPNFNSRKRTLDVEEPVQHRANVEDSIGLVDIDAEAAKTWIYPVNVPLREYQLAISKTALFSNTLVALPTGLGKTLIAAVVMYNYFRWFPEGKIVFAAPSRPLVLQQIEACHNIVGIPQEWTIDMTGLTNPAKRACLWKSKRVFFVTPQVLEKDIQSGTCLVKYLVCLVIDEAHRALGNYSYCVVVRELMMVPVPLRIVALTATPGSKQQGIQQIIDNLCISTLQYRDESDHDVIPYIHDRKIELIQVAMGEDAVEINSKLLDVIRPFVAKLCSMGLLQNRDYKTLSPCDLLNSRDKFRQAHRPDHPHIKYQDVEGVFGVLITLYHIRKLLSGHGIRPASEMLEEKLRQGSFARFMSKNDLICNVRLIMQKNLSHGAPSPKLSRMLEVLVDHFNTKDPQDSRVIIFSNFRGSVRDIMDALAKIGDIVRATEFIGQSSGKTLKGQSQKVQQAVLEKFRAGGYNVIVATSIGEEGLDIMEVDLVICFDANISPIRMIQRMGRTGRKHNGRVVVLACEGSELKGYMRKQTNSKSIKKHMQNGGTNSFTFHASPRMIPHIIRPEVQFVKLSIKQFVRPRKKLKDDHAVHTKLFDKKLTDNEAKLLLKYFHPSEDTWKPSLIAFPHFQTIPSSTHRVLHSSRTMILLNIMQHLQGLHFSRDTETLSVEEKSYIREHFEAGHVEQCSGGKRGTSNEENALKPAKKPFVYSEVSVSPPLNSAEKQRKDQISCFPAFPSKSFLPTFSPSGSEVLLSCLEHGSCNVAIPVKDLVVQTKTVDEPTTTQTKFLQDEILSSPETERIEVQGGKTMHQHEEIHQTARLKRKFSDEGDNAREISALLEIKAELPLADESRIETQLSPRLTNLVESGFVPDSPVDDCGNSSRQGVSECSMPQFILPDPVDNEVLLKSSILGESERINYYGGSLAGNDLFHSDGQTPTLKENSSLIPQLCAPTSPVVDETQTTLLPILASSNKSEDWHLVTEEKFSSVQKPRKFKRLQKVGDMEKNKNVESMEDTSVLPVINIVRSFSGTRHNRKKKRDGERRLTDNVRAFFEEEAQVSSDDIVSEDEEDDKVNSSFDSFVDDRVSASATSTQDETGRPDMMAIYRRSLLSQSPFERLTSPTSLQLPTATRVTESERSSGEAWSCFQSTVIENMDRSPMHSESVKMNHSPDIVIATAGDGPRATEVDIRKSKFAVCVSGSVPKINLEEKFSLELEVRERESVCDEGANVDIFNDDEFYEGIDLDAVEAQATLLLKKKVELPTQVQPQVMGLQQQKKMDLMTFPSFDLGI